MAGSDAKERIIYPPEKRVVNPIALLAWDLGLPPPGDALPETTGQPRRTPVCDGPDGTVRKDTRRSTSVRFRRSLIALRGHTKLDVLLGAVASR